MRGRVKFHDTGPSTSGSAAGGGTARLSLFCKMVETYMTMVGTRWLHNFKIGPGGPVTKNGICSAWRAYGGPVREAVRGAFHAEAGVCVVNFTMTPPLTCFTIVGFIVDGVAPRIAVQKGDARETAADCGSLAKVHSQSLWWHILRASEVFCTRHCCPLHGPVHPYDMCG